MAPFLNIHQGSGHGRKINGSILYWEWPSTLKNIYIFQNAGIWKGCKQCFFCFQYLSFISLPIYLSAPLPPSAVSLLEKFLLPKVMQQEEEREEKGVIRIFFKKMYCPLISTSSEITLFAL